MSPTLSACPLWRCTLKPELDWIQIRVTLPAPSQFRHVRNRMPKQWGNVFVHPVEGEHSSSAFSFRVQNPAGPDALMTEVQKLLLPGQPAIQEEAVQVQGVEVALDAYSEDDPELLTDAAFHMAWHIARPPLGQLLITEPQHYRAAVLERSVRQALLEGWSLNLGPRDLRDALSFDPGTPWDALRGYVKRHDTRDGKRYDLLAVNEHRARLERTLLGSSSPFSTIAGWRSFKFHELAPLFAMCQTDPAASAFLKMMHRAAGPLGKPDSPQKRNAHRRIRRAGTLRDLALNERIRVALRKLTRSQGCGKSDSKR